MNKTAQRLGAVFAGVYLTSIPTLFLANTSALALEALNYPTKPLPKSDPRAKLDPDLLDVPPAPTPAPQKQWGTSTTSREIGYDLKTKKTTLGPIVRSSKTSNPADSAGSPGFDPTHRKGSSTVELQQSRKVFGVDNRILIRNTTTYPWSAMTKLYITFRNGQRVVCSGTLIAAKYVLTAGHCIHNVRNGGFATRVEVIPGLYGTYKPFGSAFSRYLRTYTAWTSSQDINYDIALVTLDRSIGNSTGWLGYNYIPAINGVVSQLAGYPVDKGNGLYLYYSAGNILSSTAQRVFYQIDMYPGQSGSGVYRYYTPPGGRLGRYIFAVNAYESQAINSGTRIDAVKFNNLRSWIASGF